MNLFHAKGNKAADFTKVQDIRFIVWYDIFYNGSMIHYGPGNKSDNLITKIRKRNRRTLNGTKTYVY